MYTDIFGGNGYHWWKRISLAYTDILGIYGYPWQIRISLADTDILGGYGYPRRIRVLSTDTDTPLPPLFRKCHSSKQFNTDTLICLIIR